MLEPDIESTLTWSWLTAEDLPGLEELREATDYLDDPIERVDLAHLQDLFDAPDADPTHNAAVGRDKNGSIIAYAWGHPRQGEGELRFWLDWAVHPAWRYRGIGEACITWIIDRGMEWWQRKRADGHEEPLWMGAYIDEKLVQRVGQVEKCGLVAEKWLCDMKVLFEEFDPTKLEDHTPEGVRLAPFTLELSEQVRRAHNHAFSTVPGAQRVGRTVWEHTLQATTMRPDWSVVALAPDEHGHEQVVSYALCSGYSAEWESQGYTEGWTEFLGTVPEWRGRGVARAVLVRALKGFHAAGLAGAGLGVDVDRAEGAYRLFTDLGYRPAERLILFGLRPEATSPTTVGG